MNASFLPRTLPPLWIAAAIFLTLGTMFVAIQAVHAQSGGGSEEKREMAELADVKQEKRLREGTVLNDVVGEFQLTGDRITFFPSESKNAVRCLENLSLERILQYTKEQNDQKMWIVSGTITEYRDSNYLLIRRAIVKGSGK